MRTFVKIRQILQGSKELEAKLKELEAVTTQRLGEHEKQIRMIFDAIRQLMAPPVKGKKQIGFRVGKEQEQLTDLSRIKG
jgi:hypothetical protein